MKVSDVMTTTVHTCGACDPLSRVAGIMWHFDVGAVPVVDEAHRPVAMITDRDICMAAYTRNVAIDQLRVQSAMSKQIIAIRPDATVEACEELMRWWQIRRVPVVDDSGRLIGLVTISDLANELLHQHPPTPVPHLAQTLASISRPRTLQEAPE
jgi:CBS domain-containing protein